MEIKIQSNSQESIEFLRNYLFENEKEISVEEEYDHSPGFNKEPIVISIIIALGSAGVFTAIHKMFESYLNYKNDRLQIISEHEKHYLEQKNLHERELLKLSIDKNGKKIEMTEGDFIKIKSLDEIK